MPGYDPSSADLSTLLIQLALGFIQQILINYDPTLGIGRWCLAIHIIQFNYTELE